MSFVVPFGSLSQAVTPVALLDADDAVGAHAKLAEFFRDADGLADMGDEVGAGLFVTAGGSVEPDGDDDRPTTRPFDLILLARALMPSSEISMSVCGL